MGSTDILAMTDLCRLGEWTTRSKSYFPAHEPPPGHVGHRVDHMVLPLKERWVYALVRPLAHGGAFEVPFEGWVDEEGYVWFNEDTDLTLAIPDRPDPREGLMSMSHVQFPKVNELGNALETRLLCSPFRLPSLALRSINEKGYHASIRKHVAPLWSWKRGEDPQSINSKDGYSLVVEPLWMKLPGEETVAPVLVGTDPFAIAVRRSNLYVRNRRAFAKEFEPNDEQRKNELARIMLAQSINDSILRLPKAKERYGKAVDIAQVNRELEAFKQRRIALQKKVNRSGKNLCKFLRTDLFSLLQYASLEEETYDPAENHCEAVADHLRVLETITRQLDRCKDGCELLIEWARDADQSEHHFLSRTVLPARPLDVHVFKTTRWAGKGTLNLFRKLGPYMAARKSDVVAELGEMLVRLGAIEKLDLVPESFKAINLRLSELAATHGFEIRGEHVLQIKVLGSQVQAKLVDFADRGTTLIAKLPSEMGRSRFLAFAALDMLNVAVSLKALSEAEGPQALWKAGAGSGAAAGFLAASVMTPIVEALPAGAKQTRYLRMLYGSQAVFAGVYCILDLLAAHAAREKDDDNRAFLLYVAAGAEFGSVLAFVYMAAIPASGGVALLVLGVIAAAAYVGAMFAEDDPLYEFLENCEWGSEPYGNGSYKPQWADAAVWAWKGNYSGQVQTLLRVLARLTVSWDLKAWPDIDVSTSLVRPGTRIEVLFEATYSDGRTGSVEREFSAKDLPTGPNVKFRVKSGQPYLAHNAIKVSVRVTCRFDAGAPEEVIEAVLMEDGKGKTYGKESRVQ